MWHLFLWQFPENCSYTLTRVVWDAPLKKIQHELHSDSKGHCTIVPLLHRASRCMMFYGYVHALKLAALWFFSQTEWLGTETANTTFVQCWAYVQQRKGATGGVVTHSTVSCSCSVICHGGRVKSRWWIHKQTYYLEIKKVKSCLLPIVSSFSPGVRASFAEPNLLLEC